MARLSRPDTAGVPQHLIQRGNNKQKCFFEERDYGLYLKYLKLAAQKYQCQIHAYVLMTNHVHLLTTGQTAGGLSRMMQSLSTRYVRYINTAYQRTGTLWEGRFKSSLISSERYLLACYRYIELNPVRANITTDPINHHWSSHACNAYGQRNVLITPHERYLSLGLSDAQRCKAYLDLFNTAVDNETYWGQSAP